MQRISRRAVVLGLSVVLCTTAKADDWVKLGESNVRLSADHDVIPVTFLRGNFSKIKLKVRQNGIFVNDIAVVYSTGGFDRLSVRHHIPAGGESRSIDLRGGDRIILSIPLYDRAVRNGTTRVKV